MKAVENKEKDPVRVLSVKYPRILVIKAMMSILKQKEKDRISVERLEREIISLMRGD